MLQGPFPMNSRSKLHGISSHATTTRYETRSDLISSVAARWTLSKKLYQLAVSFAKQHFIAVSNPPKPV
jgi:hypothetical protein